MKFASSRLGKTVFDLKDVTVQAGPKVLIKHLTWQLGPGDRIGLVGVNGAGKTSLLRALTEAARSEGEIQPVAGRVHVGKTVKLAYLSQEVAELDPTWRVLQAVQAVRERVDLGKGREMTAGQLCETFGFNKDKQWTPVGDLSGGERRRLQLLRLLMDEPNVLFLDEPTNDLDIETLTQLEDVLDGWPGSMIVISHDRFFVERTTDRVFALLGDGALRMLPRGIDEYLERRKKMEEAVATSAAAPSTAKPPRTPSPRRAPPTCAPPRRNCRRSNGSSTRSPRRRPSCTRRSPRTPRTSPRWPNSTPNCGRRPVSGTNSNCGGWNSPRTPDPGRAAPSRVPTRTAVHLPAQMPRTPCSRPRYRSGRGFVRGACEV